MIDYRKPHRFAIQRRFAEAASEMAWHDFDDWYIFAHSLGSIITLKGLMYSDHGFARLISYRTWHSDWFSRFRGKSDDADGRIADDVNQSLWLDARDCAATAKIFARLKGVVTYGSPFKTFSEIWPAIIPVREMSALSDKFSWINLYDPIDPISAPLKDLSLFSVSGALLPLNDIQCKTSPIIISAHTSYWTKTRKTHGQPGLLQCLLRWCIDGEEFASASKNYYWRMQQTDLSSRRAFGAIQWVVVIATGCILWPASVYTTFDFLKFVKKRLLDNIHNAFGLFINRSILLPASIFSIKTDEWYYLPLTVVINLAITFSVVGCILVLCAFIRRFLTLKEH